MEVMHYEHGETQQGTAPRGASRIYPAHAGPDQRPRHEDPG